MNKAMRVTDIPVHGYEAGEICEWYGEPVEFIGYDYPAFRVWIKTTTGMRHPLQDEIRPL